jgi:hypothetical protein
MEIEIIIQWQFETMPFVSFVLQKPIRIDDLSQSVNVNVCKYEMQRN